MDEKDLKVMRLEMRVKLLERLVLRYAVLGQAQSLPPSNLIEKSRRAISKWLGENMDDAPPAFGRQTREPGKTGLLTEELREIVEAMQAIVSEEAADLATPKKADDQ
jgi:hypothetical protein